MADDSQGRAIDLCEDDADDRDSGDHSLQVVVFRVQAEWLALSARSLDEIVSMRPIHSLPHRRGGVILGLANVRGGLLTCMALSKLLGVPDAGMQASATHGARGGVAASAQGGWRPPRLLVLRSQPLDVALYVDEVDGVHALNTNRLKAVPSTLAGAAAQHTVGWGLCGDRQVGLLDETALHSAIQRGFLS